MVCLLYIYITFMSIEFEIIMRYVKMKIWAYMRQNKRLSIGRGLVIEKNRALTRFFSMIVSFIIQGS